MRHAHVYLAPGFEEIEFVTIVDVLRRGEVTVSVVSLDENLQQRGAHGISIEADLPFSAAAHVLADAIILPGGGPGTRALQAKGELHVRLAEHAAAGHIVAAICAAPTVLASAGLLAGRQATCYPGCEEQLVQGQAEHRAQPVLVDGHVITGQAAGSALDFSLAVLHALQGGELARQVRASMCA